MLSLAGKMSLEGLVMIKRVITSCSMHSFFAHSVQLLLLSYLISKASIFAGKLISLFRVFVLFSNSFLQDVIYFAWDAIIVKLFNI